MSVNEGGRLGGRGRVPAEKPPPNSGPHWPGTAHAPPAPTRRFVSVGRGGAGPVAVVDLGPAEPVAQRLVLYAEPLRDPGDHTGRVASLLANLSLPPARSCWLQGLHTGAVQPPAGWVPVTVTVGSGTRIFSAFSSSLAWNWS